MVLRNLWFVPYGWFKLCYTAGHIEKYTEEERYQVLKMIDRRANIGGRITIDAYGVENIPKQDGFMFFPNHQGLYDVLAILEVCPRPFSVVMKKEVENVPFLKQVFACMKAIPLDRNDLRQGLQVIKQVAEEVKENNIAVWLTPAVNIHRNPLCGRNFEYYSEDPLLAGKMAAGMVRGIQSQHIGASVKHFAANNKETNRKHSDSRVSERALREIYLKQFEIIVKESDPWTIMSSYNVINGHRASENKELLEDILRGEWGFQGMVTTDWWTRGEHYKEIKAGNDVKMATGYPERVKKAIEFGELTRADLEHCARRVLELILKID